jgi:hypothetical protein
MSTWPRYKLPTEAESKRIFGLLVEEFVAGRKASIVGVELVDVETGEAHTVTLGTPQADPMTAERAMRLAWSELLSHDIRPPDWVLGQAIGALEVQGLLYVLAHGPWPAGVGQVIQEVLSAFGVPVPGSIPGILTGAIGGAVDKLNAIEGIRIARATMDAVLTKVEEGLKGDGKIDKGEMVSAVTAGIGAAWAEATDGDSV